MARKKKTVRRRTNIDAGAYKSDNTGLDDGIRPVDAQKDEAAEERALFMKKKAEQEKAYKEGQKIESYYYEKQGKKLIKKIRKANGSMHSFYVGNFVKKPEIMENQDVKANLK